MNTTRILLLFLACSCFAAPVSAQEKERKPTGDPWLDSLPAAETLHAGEPGEGPGAGVGAAAGAEGRTSRTDAGNPWTAGAGARPQPPADAAEAEPNNSFGTAQPVAANARITGAIEPARDIDRYVFDAPRRGSLEIAFEAVPSGFAPAIEVRNTENTVVLGWTNLTARNGGTDPFIVDLGKAGRYFLAVGDAKSRAVAEPYRVVTRYLQGDRFEPNDSFGTATEVPATLELAGTILPLGDVDRYAFTVERRGAVELRLDNVAAVLDPYVEIRNTENTVILGWTPLTVRDGATEPLVVDLNYAGRYFIALSDGKGDARSDQPYRLHLRQFPGDANEPNDSFGTPTEVAAEAELSGTIMPLGDVDRYTFTVARRGALELHLDAVAENLDPYVEIRNTENVVVLGWTPLTIRDGAAEPLVVDLKYAGRYFVALSDGKGDARSDKPYRLRLHQLAGDENEPNDSIGTATPIAPDGSFTTSFMPSHDADWFRFEVDRPGMTELSFTDVPDAVSPAFALRNAENAVLINWTKPSVRDGGTQPFPLDLPAEGTYYLVLAAARGETRAVEPLHFHLRRHPADAHEPNPSVGTAAAVRLGAPFQGNVLPLGDGDWYRFEVPGAGTLDVHFPTVPDGMTPAFQVRNAESTIVLNTTTPKVRDGSTETVSIDLQEAGTYYLVVWDNARARSIEPYTVELRLQ